MGNIDDALIVSNMNYVSIYFIVMDIEANLVCPIVLGMSVLGTLGVIDMNEGIIKF